MNHLVLEMYELKDKLPTHCLHQCAKMEQAEDMCNKQSHRGEGRPGDTPQSLSVNSEIPLDKHFITFCTEVSEIP